MNSPTGTSPKPSNKSSRYQLSSRWQRSQRVERSELLKALIQPGVAKSFDLAQWNRLLRQARRAGLLPRIAWQLLRDPAAQLFPDDVRTQILAAEAVAGHFERTVRWEVNRIARALADVQTKVVLLKGAAYVMAGLPNSPGRMVSDVDILVPRDKLGEVEQAILRHGWQAFPKDDYDDYYYREWMHELPPLWHPGRKSVIDIHHTILPLTGRVHPDPAELLHGARPLKDSRFFVLSPEDIVLHSAAHLFQDGNMAGALRDLVDLDCLLQHFAASDSSFWQRLVHRSRQMNLERSLFYTIHFIQTLLDTPVPADVVAEVDRGRPRWPIALLMSFLGQQSMVPSDRDGTTWPAIVAGWLLQARGHWLRMPPQLLARHLMHKAGRRWWPRKDEAAAAP